MGKKNANLKINKNASSQVNQVMWLSISEKNGSKPVKTALLLSNVVDADHQNSCLFTNKGHFSSPSYVLIGVLSKFHA